jgi:hypothetical protein
MIEDVASGTKTKTWLGDEVDNGADIEADAGAEAGADVGQNMELELGWG